MLQVLHITFNDFEITGIHLYNPIYIVTNLSAWETLKFSL